MGPKKGAKGGKKADPNTDLANLTEDDIHNNNKKQLLNEIFDLYDEDESGTIDLCELGTVVRAMGYAPSERQVQQLLERFDKNADGVISRPELWDMVTAAVEQGDLLPEADDDEAMLEAFKAFDKDGSGKVSRKELLQALTTQGEVLTMEQAKVLINCADVDEDGQLDFEEFKQLMIDRQEAADYAAEAAEAAEEEEAGEDEEGGEGGDEDEEGAWAGDEEAEEEAPAEAEAPTEDEAPGAAAAPGESGASTRTGTSVRAKFLDWSDAKLKALKPPAPSRSAEEAEKAAKEAKPPVKGEAAQLIEGEPVYQVTDGSKWYFFNGTSSWVLNVSFTFDKEGAKFKVLGTAKQKKSGGEIEVTDTVYPGECKPFIDGETNGYSSSYGLDNLPDDYKKKLVDANDEKKQKEVAAVEAIRAKVRPRVAELAKQLAAAGEVVDNLEDELTLQECLKAGIKYVDATFSPTKLAGDDIGSAFARPEWWLPKGVEPELFAAPIKPTSVGQGGLGDCYLICSLAAIAEFPVKVQDVFDHPDCWCTGDERKRKLRIEQRLGGAYRVCYNKGGWWLQTIVDEYLPGPEGPIYARNPNVSNEMWVSMMEKAYAKIHNGYQKIVGGRPMDVISELTGYPSYEFDEWIRDAAKRDALFDRLVHFDEEKFIMAVSTPGDEADKNAKFEKAGLTTGHAFTLIGARKFVDPKTKQPIRIAQIRNPWGGETEWTGSWSDKSDLWKAHPQIAKAVDFKPSEDGSFWMDWNDVCEYFVDCGVCYVKYGWHDYRIRGKTDKGQPTVALEIVVHEPTEMCIMLSQKDHRMDPSFEPMHYIFGVAKHEKGNKYKPTTFATWDPEETTNEEKAEYGTEHSMFVKLEPTTGKAPYIVYAREHSDQGTGEYTMSVIANRQVGPTTFEVNFRKVAIDLGDGYVVHNAAKPVSATAEFQITSDVTAPLTFRGTHLVAGPNPPS